MAAGSSGAPPGVRFTPLLGVGGGQPLSYLLELAGFAFLLDCGWSDAYDVAQLAPVLAVLPRVDAVLLSHSDPQHLGALPYLVGRAGLAAPVYATSPVHKMGQMAMYDQYLSRQAQSEFDTFNLDDVDAAFARVTPLRYQQNLALSGKGVGITLTPFAAGHLLGGAVWRIRWGGEDFVYAVDYNHRKERHLNGTALESAFQRPALLISDALNALQSAPEKSTKEKDLLEAVMTTLRGDGSVLLPIDTAGRLLELVLLLEKHWSEHRLTYPLVLLSAMAYSTLEFAKSQLEWMNEALTRQLGHARDNPFSTRFLKLCSSREELSHLPHGPKLVLATLPSLEAGFSRNLFADWAEDPRNAVVFVTAAEEGTLGARVQALASGTQQPGQPPPTVTMLRAHRVPLEGQELEEHLAAQAAAAEATAAAQAAETAAAAAQQAVAAAEAAAAADGGLLSPRASRAVPRVNSVAIGHLRSGRGSGGAPGEVVAADGQPVEEQREAAATAACLVEGFEVPKGAAAPLFPFEDEWEHAAWDEYGASLDYSDFEMEAKGFKAMETELAAEAEAEDAGGAPPDVPTKVVSAPINVTVRARVLRFDFEGRSDGRSMRTMLAHVAPRQLILMHGAPEATAALAAHLQRELAGLLATVHTPAEGQAVELPAEPAYTLALCNELMAGVRLHQIGDYRLAWVEGVSQLPQLLPGAGSEAGYGGVFIGDVRLSQLKQALAAAGIASEFHAGSLYCAGHVVVRRRQPAGGGGDGEEGGGLLVEGALSEEYYRIREVVYAQYHIC
ncbi:cleavage and polyadenylation specificity factor subunit 2 [Micractinium conductrix]|uniref:Cleavage and polyadenylation specificity factor subunit 2 n=1 Tax=Micractinium conductrix TaxID=554055 RepID=A0A2P6VIQ6_9CHLO|nr:cleavage and polyadenylation specificity factor subunit 2 [Micractinium conductrix]|eukprot:PSC73960.1 cleavage and polyadenylation specificity factor subunit 2 [Micractinium conductrix]